MWSSQSAEKWSDLSFIPRVDGIPLQRTRTLTMLRQRANGERKTAVEEAVALLRNFLRHHGRRNEENRTAIKAKIMAAVAEESGWHSLCSADRFLWRGVPPIHTLHCDTTCCRGSTWWQCYLQLHDIESELQIMYHDHTHSEGRGSASF